MKKVLVIGSSGAGKSVFSRRLGEISGLPVIHLDRHHWRPGWTEPPRDIWEAQVVELLKGDEWIIDGNFGGTMEIRLASCDTVIFLDLPRLVCTWGVVKRVITYRGDTRPDLAPDCPEKIDLPFIKWVWDFPTRSRPRVLERISKVEGRASVHRLRSRREIDAYLAELSQRYGKNGHRTV